MSEVVIEFDLPEQPLNMNDRDGSARTRGRTFQKKEAWRTATYYAAVQAFGGVGPSGRRR